MEIIDPCHNNTENNDDTDNGCRTYRRRWAMLLMFWLCSICSSSHYMQFSIINNIVTNYYDVSSRAVDWTGTIYMATYILLIFPVSWLIQRKGLRLSLACGAFFLCAGSWLKVFSPHKDRFVIAFLGQTLIGVSQVFTLPLPVRLSVVWFPSHQVSTATALCVFGDQAGLALSFFIPTIAVKESLEGADLVGKQLYNLFLSEAIIASVILLLIFFFFEAAPPFPPSIAQKKNLIANSNETSYSSSLKRLLFDFDFDLLLLSQAIFAGTFICYLVLLNQIVVHSFPEGAEDVGRLGVALLVGGVAGSLVWGVILDKIQRYKSTAISIILLATASMVTLIFLYNQQRIIYAYFVITFIGFLLTGYLIVSYEFGAELIYPEPEATSNGLILCMSQLGGVISSIAAGVVMDYWGPVVTNVYLIVILSSTLLFYSFIDGSKLKRSAANKNDENKKQLC